MLLTQDTQGNYTKVNEDTYLANVHNPDLCAGRGCAIHNHPSNHPLKDAPMNWRQGAEILERLCEHGVGHPDADSAKYLASIGNDYANIHSCDGCCVPEEN